MLDIIVLFFVAIGLKFFVFFLFHLLVIPCLLFFLSSSLVFILHIYERSYSSGEKEGYPVW